MHFGDSYFLSVFVNKLTVSKNCYMFLETRTLCSRLDLLIKPPVSKLDSIVVNYAIDDEAGHCCSARFEVSDNWWKSNGQYISNIFSKLDISWYKNMFLCIYTSDGLKNETYSILHVNWKMKDRKWQPKRGLNGSRKISHEIFGHCPKFTVKPAKQPT
jgi:hypothetical protein